MGDVLKRIKSPCLQNKVMAKEAHGRCESNWKVSVRSHWSRELFSEDSVSFLILDKETQTIVCQAWGGHGL